MNWTKAERVQLARAIDKNMTGVSYMYPTKITSAEHEALKRAEIEHAPGIACRMNPVTFRIEYYNEKTGEIVSSHI